MKSKTIIFTTLACMSLILSACGGGGGGGSQDGRAVPTTPLDNRQQTQQNQNNDNYVMPSPPLNVQIAPEHKKHVEFITMNEGINRGYQPLLDGTEKGFMVLKPNSYVVFTEGGVEYNYASPSTATTDSTFEIYSTDIVVLTAVPVDEEVANATTQVLLDEDGFAIVPEQAQTNANQTGVSNSSDPSVLQVLPQGDRPTAPVRVADTTSVDPDFIDIGDNANIDNQKLPLPGRVDNRPELGNEPKPPGTPGDNRPIIPYYKKIASISPFDKMIEATCNAGLIKKEIFSSLSVNQILTNDDALRALRCIARSPKTFEVTELYNTIVRSEMTTGQDVIDIIKAINVPVLAMIMARQDGTPAADANQVETAMDILSSVYSKRPHNYAYDINYAVKYLHDFKDKKYFSEELRQRMEIIMVKHLASYTSNAQKRKAKEPLARLLRLASHDKKQLKSYFAELLRTSDSEKVDDERMDYLVQVLGTTATLLTQKDCKKYYITDRQAKAFKDLYRSAFSNSLYNELLDRLDDTYFERTKRNPGTESNARCELLDAE